MCVLFHLELFKWFVEFFVVFSFHFVNLPILSLPTSAFSFLYYKMECDAPHSIWNLRLCFLFFVFLSKAWKVCWSVCSFAELFIFSFVLSYQLIETNLVIWVAESVRNVWFIFKLFLLSGLLVSPIYFLLWNRKKLVQWWKKLFPSVSLSGLGEEESDNMTIQPKILSFFF